MTPIRSNPRLLPLIAASLVGLALWVLPAWSQGGPTVAEALVRGREAGLPDALLGQVLADAYDAGFQPAAAARTVIALVEARRLAFDLQPFHDRFQEGLAKRIDGARIAQALEERLKRQTLVRECLRRAGVAEASTTPENEVSLADGLEMGLTPQELDTILQRVDDAPLAMAVVAAEMWALLKQLDFAPALTDRIVTEGLSRQTLHPAWRHFPQIVVIARQKGVPDRETGGEALKSLQTGGDPAGLLARLGFTGRNLKTGPMGAD